MGFLDIFRKRKQPELSRISYASQINQQPYDINLSYTPDGRLVVELYERFIDENQGYDTTKLIVDDKPVNLDGNFVQNCMVSWYGRNDCDYLKGYRQGYERKNNYRNVLAEIDTNSLQVDGNYCFAVMKQLLNRKIVIKSLEMGLQDKPYRPCGKYVGGVLQTSTGYKRNFNLDLGEASHNSPEMCTKRQELKEEEERKHANWRASKRAQIAKLQKELDDDLQQ